MDSVDAFSSNALSAASTSIEEESFGALSSDSLVASLLMIFVSEIGDKTFLIAAILSMSSPRLTIFLAACSALWIMSVLSAFLGHTVVTFIPMSLVSLSAAIMFFVFGIKLLLEAHGMQGNEIDQEMNDVEAELSEKDTKASQLAMEAGEANFEQDAKSGDEEADSKRSSFNVNVDCSDESSMNGSVGCCKDGSILASAKNLMAFLLSPLFVETFVLVFLAEWGDRSQLATIALGAAKNVYAVSIGTILGHTCCTGIAVIGGRMLASRISVKKVTYAGGAFFIIFSCIYCYEAFHSM